MGYMETLVNGYKRSTSDVKTLVRKDISDQFELVKDAVCGSVYYSAYRHKETGRISAIVVKTYWRKGGSYGDFFGTKYISEFDGPTDANCPESIISLLSQTDDEWALEWRERCLKNAELRKKNEAKNRKLRGLPVGTCITFKSPIATEHHKCEDEIHLRKYGRCGTKRDVWADGVYRWKPALIPEDFEVISA